MDEMNRWNGVVFYEMPLSEYHFWIAYHHLPDEGFDSKSTKTVRVPFMNNEQMDRYIGEFHQWLKTSTDQTVS